MKTTINLPDGLWESAKRHAKKNNTTMTALIQAGLYRVLQENPPVQGFTLPDCSFGQGGLTPEFSGRSWNEIREEIYSNGGG